jgi:hypothetical protein
MATLAVTNSFSAGTTIVAADMNENFDDIEAFVNTTPGVVQNDIVDAKGDIIAATAADAVSRLAVGTDTYVLTADSGEATGLVWAAPTTGDVTGVAAGANIDVTSASGPVPSVALAIDAAVDFGSDGSGVDVSFHSATAGDLMLWDASDEKLVITGTNGQNSLEVADGNVSITDDLTVSGNCTIQTLDMDTIVEGDVIYGSGADTLARLAKGSDDEVLTLASGVPSWAAVSAGVSWSGSTANGIGTYGSSSSIVSESTATYDGTTLELTTSGGGLKLDNLASSDANTLDDYEEGTCTLAFTPASGTITMHGGTNGSYTKIGRMVTVCGKPTVSSVSTPSGATALTGLPFTLNADGEISSPSGAFKIGGYSGTINHTPTSTPSTGEAKVSLIDGLAANIDGARFTTNTEMTFTFAYQI